MLKAMRIPYIILDSNENDAFIQLHDIIQSAKTKNIPHAIIIRKDVFGKYKLQKSSDVIILYLVRMLCK